MLSKTFFYKQENVRSWILGKCNKQGVPKNTQWFWIWLAYWRWVNKIKYNPLNCIPQSVHIHCRHIILAHLFSHFLLIEIVPYSPTDFRISVPLSSFPFLPYFHTLLVSLSHIPFSLSLSVSLFLSPTHLPIYLSLSLILSSSLSFSHSPFSL